MTREGFIELRLKHTGGFTKAAVPAEMLREMIANEVDFYISAGMLKLDEPESPAAKLWEIYTNGHSTNADDLLKEIEEAGLRIVEK